MHQKKTKKKKKVVSENKCLQLRTKYIDMVKFRLVSTPSYFWETVVERNVHGVWSSLCYSLGESHVPLSNPISKSSDQLGTLTGRIMSATLQSLRRHQSQHHQILL